MTLLRAASVALCLFALPGAAMADISDPIAAMIKAAAQSGDAAELAAVVKAAKTISPEAAAEIDALANQELATVQSQAAARREAELRSQGYFEGWGGSGEVGFNMSRGNTRETSGVVGLKLAKDGVKLRHEITALADYLRSGGATTREKFNAAYALDYKIDDRLYVFGMAMWERDTFAGYSRRFTENVGIGYSVIQEENMSLNVEAGPSLRQTRYITGDNDNQLAARAGLNYLWDIREDLTFSQDATAYWGSGGSTYTSATALTTRLFGAFSARVSFNVQHETNPPLGLKKTDYYTRLTGVYDF